MITTTDLSTLYYGQLTEWEKGVYIDLLNGLRLREKNIVCPEVINPARVVSAINFDRPELFFINWLESYRMARIDGKSIFNFSYLYDREESVALERRIDDYARDLPGISVYGKVRALYEKLAKTLTYDNAGLRAAVRSPSMFNAVGPLLHKKAVCEGVSKFASAVLKRLQVDVSLAVGTHEGVPHAWNVYRYKDGTLAYSDFTFGIGVWHTAAPYAYFNLTYEEMARDHVFEGLPQ